MWLHIIFNDKFAPVLVETFEEALPGQHIYCMYAPPKLVSIPTDFHLIRSKKSFLKLMRSRSDWEGVIFNPCDPISWRWLPCISKDLKVIWYRWGYEYYNYWRPLIKHHVYLPKTKRWIDRNRAFSKRLKEMGMMLFSRIERRHLKRVDYFIGPEYEEYRLLREVGLLHATTEYRFGCVGTMSQYINGAGRNEGKNILLGNSATPTNNHIEAIDWLSALDLGNRMVITPLSYGDEEYREMICQYGYEKLGSNFHPITEFMPFQTYQKLLQGCSIAVMNHLRQQAGGNITQMVANGAKVYLNDTPIYKSYKSWGGHVYLIQETPDEDILNPLSESQIAENKNLLQERKSHDFLISEVRKLLASGASASPGNQALEANSA